MPCTRNGAINEVQESRVRARDGLISVVAHVKEHFARSWTHEVPQYLVLCRHSLHENDALEPQFAQLAESIEILLRVLHKSM